MSQFEGFFGQLSFQTSNFLGRGESLTLSAQGGTQATNYSLAFTEPFLFDRNITGGANVFRSEVRYIGQFTQQTTGAMMSLGLPVGRGFTRMFTSYSYERVHVTDINEVYLDCHGAAAESLSGRLAAHRLRAGSASSATSRRASSTTASTSRSSRTRARSSPRRSTSPASAATRISTSRCSKPSGSSSRTAGMSLGMRGQFQYIHNFTGTQTLPIFEKLFMGGDYTVRGYDFRTIGPSDPITGLVLGGNKSLLFNVEQNFNIASAVRLILFYDAGQVKDIGQPFSWKEDAIERVLPTPPILFDPLASQTLVGSERERRDRPRSIGRAERIQDLDGRRGPLLHAGAERAVPPDLRLQPAAGRRAQQPAAAAGGLRLPFRGRDDRSDKISLLRFT